MSKREKRKDKKEEKEKEKKIFCIKKARKILRVWPWKTAMGGQRK